ncbi:metallophosphoesterase family protein [Aquiflexum sp. LQ15W]|uniref:purple acid phosphatase family protein n=1 Tax=Cognataquiflexum nitidum TaxID=2922272 RepID=UPI001F141A2B|nr:metallophosphoesterase family protein [Cognataquiflexum nitidum]MCH6201401.1 metallophosphoesterase family protein [Cognataquiflexum nitidum]
MLTFLILFSLLFPKASLQSTDSVPIPAKEFWFWNQYDLPRNAATKSSDETVFLKDFQKFGAGYSDSPYSLNQPISAIYKPFESQNVDFSKSFALEFLLLNHVNNPAGISWEFWQEEDLKMAISVFDKKVINGLMEKGIWQKSEFNSKTWKKYWNHYLLNFDGKNVTLFEQGEMVWQKELDKTLEGSQLILKSFLDMEPYMEAHDILKKTAIYQQALTEQEIADIFPKVEKQISAGKLYSDKFHLIAGPYLNDISENSAQLVWETDRATKAILTFGEKIPLEMTMNFDASTNPISTAIFENLKPETTYFYQIEFETESGEKLSTPVLSFQTAKPIGNPFLFGIISDTESRPQVNNQVAQGLWEERPDFLIHLGDLTDGGFKDSKFEWTMEYFQGVGALTSRVPVATVPGNGDGDLNWYKQYHPHTGEKGFYRFDFGDASFFMLNSNPRKDLQKGGEQYVWLENELTKSEAKWSFVVLHHAPYSADEDDYGNTWREPGNQGDPQLKDLISLVEANEVKMVFFGHLHTYMRSHPLKGGKVDSENGTVYVQAGGAGGNLEDNAPTRAWFTAKNFRGHHYCTVQVIGDSLELRTYNLEGEIIDVVTIKK